MKTSASPIRPALLASILLAGFALAGFTGYRLPPAAARTAMDFPSVREMTSRPGEKPESTTEGGSTAPSPVNTPPAGDSEESLAQRLQQAQEEEQRLRSAIEVLRHNLISRMALCERFTAKAAPPEARTAPEAPQTATPEAAPEPEQPSPSPAELMPTSPEPAPEPKKPDGPRKTREQGRATRGQELSIPQKSVADNDLSFLEGCWRYVPGTMTLTLEQTGGEADGEYCFDAKGVGYRNIRKRRNNDLCSGPARASFDAQGNLVLHAEQAICSKEPNKGYAKDRKLCIPGPDGKAPCSARSEHGTRWSVTLQRK
ncbi:hypothetical protein LJC59_08135 [Desulfovibrio sp. OttesenSCG-928-A18]|nr:hypothetical protein [Desulfovibrio sp. OttesenSCG-928-A18]